MAESITRDPSRDRELVESIRAGEPMHIKQGPLISTIASASLARLLDLATAGLDAVSHPAALERARAEGAEAMREACAVWVSDEWKPMDPPGMYEAEALADAYTSGEIDAAASIADCIRHVLPAPRPSPEAEAPKESATKWLAVNFRKRAQALRVAAEHGESPAAWHVAAETYETAAGVAERWRPTPGAVEATTAPALAPELRERVRKLLAMPANIDNWTTYCIEARALLSALSSDQPEPKEPQP